MKDLQTFDFEQQEVRTVLKNGEPWFIAKDVCEILEIKNTSQAIQRLREKERAMFNIGRQGETNIINEQGLYRLILRSDKENAIKFQDWIVEKVLPSIRKTGSYGIPDDPIIQLRINQLEQEKRLSAIEIKLDDKETLLLAPKKTKRAKLNQIVRDHAYKHNLDYRSCWNTLYSEVYYRLNINVTVRAKNEGIAIIDWIIENDMLDSVLSIAVEIFIQENKNG
jgi:anti-repressor protein